jgi:MYXO-CTERM domain-containing protein
LRSSIFFAALLAVGALPSAAHAFADASQFFDQKTAPHAATFGASGEGLYFTGAPRFASLDCSSCHAGGPQKVGLLLNADDPTLFSTGYQPGKTYELQVELTNETEGLMYKTPTCTDPTAQGDNFTYVQCNNNGFALEIDAGGLPLAGPSVYCAKEPAAGMCPPADFTADEALVAPDGDAVFDAKVYSADPNMPKLVMRNGADAWRFWWTAPKAGTGPLTVYVAAVDGNGGAGTVANDQDPYDDDTVTASFFLQEAGVPVKNSASAGCSVGSSASPASAWWLLVAALGLLRRRARVYPMIRILRICPRARANATQGA